jgi:putative alpha-1,2-mannosidase
LNLPAYAPREDVADEITVDKSISLTDTAGLTKLMGGKKKFVDKLQMVFDKKYYDMANEPDIAYPYLFSNFKGEEWRTQKTVRGLLRDYYHNAPNGLPGNDDTGTMSAWAVFAMMGFYPACLYCVL